MFENIPVADLAIGRSTVRQRILAILMAEPAGRLHLREIQRRARTSPGTASRELAKLVAAGLIEREAEGAQVYFRASSSPFAAMMRSLLIIAPAPPDATPRPVRLPRPEAAASKSTEQIDAPAEPAHAPAEQGRLEDDPAAIPAIAPIGPTEPIGPLVDDATIWSMLSPAEPDPTDDAHADAQDVPDRDAPTQPASETAPLRVFRPVAPDALISAWSSVPELVPPPIAEPRQAADPIGLQVARRIAESVESLYAESGRLRGIYLYGRRAEGSSHPDAEVETLIVLDRVDRYGAELERTSHLFAALSHEHKLVVSRVFVSESDWLTRQDGSLPTIRARAVEI